MMSLSSIREAGQERYLVELLDGESTRTYMFRVEIHHGIELLAWDETFGDMVVNGQWLFTPLFEAVLAFHRARSIGIAR